ncbi:MAG: hypothetical protein ACHP9U_07180, partial [Steroidobacterales bacterium]
MTLFSTGRSAIVAAGVLAGLAVAAHAFAAGGNLSISPAIIEHTANPGGVGTIRISNTTGTPIAVRLAVRPWLQSRG